MSPLVILIATAALGVEVGWEPIPTGGYEYSIQLEPDLIDLLRRGTDEITSEVPPQIDVRRYRLFVGTGKLPRVEAAPPATEPAAPHLPAKGSPDHGAAVPAGDIDLNAPDPFGPTNNEQHTAAHPPEASKPPASFGTAVHPVERSGEHPGASEIPAHLSTADERAKPLDPASFGAPADGHDSTAAKTPKDGLATPKSGNPEDEAQPWMPFLIAVALLSCSLGANVYLGWIAWDARSRYRDSAAKLRAMAAA